MKRHRVLAIGDIHGCLEELRELLRLAEYSPATDRLVFLGDLIDRGPDPVGIVRFVRELGAESVKGNHDEKAVRWHRHETARKLSGTPNPMAVPELARLREWEGLSGDVLRWIDSLPWADPACRPMVRGPCRIRARSSGWRAAGTPNVPGPLCGSGYWKNGSYGTPLANAQ